MRRILSITVVLVAGLALAGCSSSASDGSAGAISAEQAPDIASEPAEGVAGDTADLSKAEDRQVVTTGSATITATDPVDAADTAVGIVESAGGRVDARQQQAPVDGDKGSASLTVRIPSADLTKTLDAIKALGRVENVQLAADDVTRESQDLDARITVKRASVDRLLALLEKASTTKDLIALETAISDRQADLESMEAEQRSLADQVALSTIDVAFISEADAPVDTPDTFWSGLAAGWNGFVGFIAGTLVVIGVAIPWLVFFGVLALVAVVIVRVRRRRRTPRDQA